MIIAIVPPLQCFQPEIRTWFEQYVGQPTQAQCQAWPLIQAGEHVMLTAPTGSGKTMAAFLCALNRLIADSALLGKTRILYISPLKALNNDIQRNLLAPLKQLKQVYTQQNKVFPTINVMVRSGDTSQSERRKMLRQPPEILITTPESLNLLLSTNSGRLLLSDLHTLILDEIHAVISSKRGAHLMCAIERLPRLCGELQRIALSATVKPIETAAQFIGGYRLSNSNMHQPCYQKRLVNIVKVNNDKRYHIQVTGVADDANNEDKTDFWHPLVERFCTIVANNQSTLLFTNSRRLCEKITMKINQASGDRIAYSHHGSLSREIRAEVEHKLKEGELKAIVATHSLELGIDIGALDEVILVQSPPSISATIQRLGRAGHSVGQSSHGRLFPTHPEDFLHAAVLAKTVQEQDIEDIAPIRCPLDVLAQVIISCCANESYNVDDLYTHIRCSYTFYELPRHHYDLIIQMLSGRYADTRIRELKPRLSWDQIDNTIVATKGAVLALYMSGGTIPNRGYYQLRDVNSHALIGELDEEFVWEASLGQIFTLGTQHWRIEKITHNDVLVSPGVPKNSAPPFWRAENAQRNFYLSCKIGELLAQAEQYLACENNGGEQTLFELLKNDHAMDDTSVSTLINYLKKQRHFTGQSLPHRYHLLVEHISSGPDGNTGNQLVLHTSWGGAVNRPYALALEAAWEDKTGAVAKFYADDNCVVVQLPQPMRAPELLSMVSSANLEKLLKQRLEGSGFFAARFRESAGRALLLTKTKFNQRLPLWMTRLQAQKLHASVDKFTDFPILLESWRCCLQDEFDLPHCHQVLAELSSGQMSWSETFSSTPSPFAHAISWGQITQYMYMEDRTPDHASSNLRDELLQDVVYCSSLRPAISTEVIAAFECKRQRLYSGYCPSSTRELLDWIKERVMLPIAQWQQLLEVIERDTSLTVTNILDDLSQRACFLRIANDTPSRFVVSVERLPQILTGLYHCDPQLPLPAAIILEALTPEAKMPTMPNVETVENPQWVAISTIAQWLSFYGPMELSTIALTLAIPVSTLKCLLDDLIESRVLISGILVCDNEQQQVCDAENFESLLRLQRLSAVPVFTPLPYQFLPLFVAEHQGMTSNNGSIDGVFNALECLRGYSAPAAHWEQTILPARVWHYDCAWIDSLMQEGEFYWLGGKKKNISFWFYDEMDLCSSIDYKNNDILPQKNNTAVQNIILSALENNSNGLDFSELRQVFVDRKDVTVTSDILVDSLWYLVWSKNISNTTFSAVRKGLEHKFSIPILSKNTHAQTIQKSRRRSVSRSRYAKRADALPYIGRWFLLDSAVNNNTESDQLIELEENAKDKARILLDRYGVVFRALVSRENEYFSWRQIFRALRLMELSGEVLTGQFFSDIPGPQFITHSSFRRLQKPLPEKAVFWMNATDPASLCGTAIDQLKSSLPKRLATTQLVYCGSSLALVSERGGKSVYIYLDVQDPKLMECFELFHVRFERQFQPDKRIVIETINGDNANRSPYLDSLKLGFDVWIDHKQVVLQRRYAI